MIDYLSGNVPGGIGLYIFLILIIFLVLFGISRRNDLFTPRHFKIWFSGVWLVVTMIYIAVWLANPPPSAFSRYGVFFHSQEPADRWLAYYFRDEVSKRLNPGRSATDYQYLQRWNYLAAADCEKFDESHCEKIARELPLNEMAVGEIQKHADGYSLALNLKHYPEGSATAQAQIRFSENAPQEAVPQILAWLQSYFPLRDGRSFQESPEPNIVYAKDAFFRQDYQKSLQLCQELLKIHPENESVRKWYYYNKIRLAKELYASEKPDHNPYNQKKSPAQLMAQDARIYLIQLAKRNYENDIKDELLSNMIAESFMLEELYGDAEQFLKIGFGENPYSLEILQNLTLLHPSRLKGLPLGDEDDLVARILNICPSNEAVLKKYIEKLLLNVQVTKAQSDEIKGRIDKALALNPASIVAWMLKGKYFNMNFDYEAALAAFQKADSLSPEDGVIQYNLGVTYFKMERPEEAEHYFQNAVKISDYLNAHLYLGAIYKDRGEYEKALERFRHRVANKEGDDDYYALQAMKGIRECLKALDIPIPN